MADTREVLVADLGPGGLVDVMIALADANVNVDLAYTALGGEQGRDRHRRRAQRARSAHVARSRRRRAPCA